MTATNPHPKRRLHLVTRDENRANLHPTYYEDLEEVWGRDTPLSRRFLFGEWIEFATEQPFHRDWILFWSTPEEPAPDHRELVIRCCTIRGAVQDAVCQPSKAYATYVNRARRLPPPHPSRCRL